MKGSANFFQYVMLIPSIFFGAITVIFLRQPIVVETPAIHSVDAMVVLGGGRGQRVAAAVSQYKQYQSSMIFLTGGQLFYGKPDAHHMWDYAVSMGVPDAMIYSIDDSQSTMADALLLKQYLLANGLMIDRLLIVTSRYHTGRSKWVFDRVFDGFGVELYVLSVDDGVDYDVWWMNYNMAEIVLLEKARFLLYRLVGALKPSILEL